MVQRKPRTVHGLERGHGLKDQAEFQRKLDTRRYSLGPAVLTLDYDVVAQMEIRDIARPYMQDLAEYADASIYLGAPNGTEFINVDASMSMHAERRARWPFFLASAHVFPCTAQVWDAATWPHLLKTSEKR